VISPLSLPVTLLPPTNVYYFPLQARYQSPHASCLGTQVPQPMLRQSAVIEQVTKQSRLNNPVGSFSLEMSLAEMVGTSAGPGQTMS